MHNLFVDTFTLRLRLVAPIQRAILQGVRHGGLHAGVARQARVVVHQRAFLDLLTGEQHKQVIVLLLQLAVLGSLARVRRSCGSGRGETQ